MRLFIFGLGYTSTFFARSFGGAFSAVSGTVRSPEKATALKQQGLEALLFEAPAVAQKLQETDVLLVSIPPRALPGLDADPVLASYRAALAASPVRKIVYLSTIGVYGDQDGGWVDEATPAEPATDRSAVRVLVEQQWLDFAAESGKSVQILRLAGIYGPGQNAIRNLLAGTAKRILKPGQVFNRIHVEDIGRAILAALTLGVSSGVLNVADDEPAPPQDVVTYAAALLGVAPPPMLDFATAPMSEMARTFYSKNQRVSNRRLREVFKVDLAYPTYREGMQALLKTEKGNQP